MICRFVAVVNRHNNKLCFRRIDCSNGLTVERAHKGVARLDVLAEVLTNIVVLHFPIVLIVELALHKTPLVVPFLYVLPIDPCRRTQIFNVVDKALRQAQVARNPIAAASGFAHPEALALAADKICQLTALHDVATVGVDVPLRNFVHYATVDVCLNFANRCADIRFVGRRYNGR